MTRPDEMSDIGEEANEHMSETPTPATGRSKRRGLALPPRGQALSRLQDLEADVPDSGPAERLEAAPALVNSNAVNTARSKSVNEEVSTASGDDGNTTDDDPARPAPEAPVANAHVLRPAGAPAYRPAVRAAREPTTRITVDMPDSLHRQISVLSAETRRSIKELVIEALEVTYFGKQEDGR